MVDTKVRPQFAGDETIVYTRNGFGYYRPDEQHFAAYEEDCEAAKVEWLCPDIFRQLGGLYNLSGSFEDWAQLRFEMLRRSLEQWNPEWLKLHPEHSSIEEAE